MITVDGHQTYSYLLVEKSIKTFAAFHGICDPSVLQSELNMVIFQYP